MQSNDDRLNQLMEFVSSHFMFNVLSKLQAEILKENKKEALNVLSLYSKLTRIAYNICDKPSITLKQEGEFLELYLKLEKLRFSENHLKYIISGFDTVKFSLEPFTIQPFIEFAVLAGIGNAQLTIEISFDENSKEISIVSDIQNHEKIEKLLEKRKNAENILVNYKRSYEIKHEKNRYLQKIYL
ncbi:MAG: histidine kinase [Bacteroidetes bacterium]|nr:histidine kinase [Bacteroidota bacterium]